MHYSEIEMAESMSASTKISTRNLVCRLYVHGGSHESRYNLRICRKAGLSKDLYLKVYKTCGNAVKFLRTIRSVMCYMLCRGGVTFVNKMDQFIWRAQSVCYTMHNIIVMCSTLTAIFTSAVEAKRLYQRICHTKDSMWTSRNKRGWWAYRTFTSCQNAACSNKFFSSAR